MITGQQLEQDAKRIRMQRPRSAEGDQREIARIVALLDRHEAQRAEHVLVDDIDDALRGVDEADAQQCRDRLHGFLRRLLVERHFAAEQVRPAGSPASRWRR